MKLQTLSVGLIDTNCYLLEDGGELIVIDPGGSQDQILKAIGNQIVKLYVLTHRHWDHIAALPYLLKEKPAPIAIGSLDAESVLNCGDNGNRSLSAFERRLVPKNFNFKRIDRQLNEGDIVTVGSISLQVIATPGHTAGSICLYDKDNQMMFTGDTIFADGSYGRCDLPSGSETDMILTLGTKFVDVDNDVAIYPGHGARSSFGIERTANIYLQ